MRNRKTGHVRVKQRDIMPITIGARVSGSIKFGMTPIGGSSAGKLARNPVDIFKEFLSVRLLAEQAETNILRNSQQCGQG